MSFSLRTQWVVALIFSLNAPSYSFAYSKKAHTDLITDAYSQEPKLLKYASRAAMLRASMDVDEPLTNDDANQYRHSMRSKNATTRAAQLRTDAYIQSELNAAINAAKQNPPDTREAGYHLGRVLHAVQDRKHNWTSCHPQSNPEANNRCSTSSSGCPVAGTGNHGLGQNCEPIFSLDSDLNYQINTDFHAYRDKAVRDRAEQDTRTYIEMFVNALP